MILWGAGFGGIPLAMSFAFGYAMHFPIWILPGWALVVLIISLIFGKKISKVLGKSSGRGGRGGWSSGGSSGGFGSGSSGGSFGGGSSGGGGSSRSW